MLKCAIPALATAIILGFASTPARASDNFFAALFEDRPAPEEMVATYDDQKLARQYPDSTREMVDDPTNERPGTVTVDTRNRYLYLSMVGGRAWRYGVGVGRQGFTWKGRTNIGRKEAWPNWTPPAAMLKRRPDLPRHMLAARTIPWARAPCISIRAIATLCSASTAPTSPGVSVKPFLRAASVCSTRMSPISSAG